MGTIEVKSQWPSFCKGHVSSGDQSNNCASRCAHGKLFQQRDKTHFSCSERVQISGNYSSIARWRCWGDDPLRSSPLITLFTPKLSLKALLSIWVKVGRRYIPRKSRCSAWELIGGWLCWPPFGSNCVRVSRHFSISQLEAEKSREEHQQNIYGEYFLLFKHESLMGSYSFGLLWKRKQHTRW